MNVTSPFFTVGSFVSNEAAGLPPSGQEIAALAAATGAACYVDADPGQCAALSYQLGKTRTQSVAAGGSGLPSLASAQRNTYTATLAAQRQATNTMHGTVLSALATLGSKPSLAAAAPACTTGAATLASAYTPFKASVQ